MSTPRSETKLYHHGQFSFGGGTIPNAFTAYRTYGDPANPCIVFPTCYGAKLDSECLYWVVILFTERHLLQVSCILLMRTRYQPYSPRLISPRTNPDVTRLWIRRSTSLSLLPSFQMERYDRLSYLCIDLIFLSSLHLLPTP